LSLEIGLIAGVDTVTKVEDKAEAQ